MDNTIKSIFRDCTDQLDGRIPGTDIKWCEALKIRLDYKLGHLWLLLEPSVYVPEKADEAARLRSAGFIREKLARRYNKQWNCFLDAWITFLLGSGRERTFRTFGIEEGVDAKFSLGRITGFSRRALGQ